MSNALTDLRDRLKQAFEDADLHAFTVEPEKVTPPVVFVGPADDNYLTFEGANYGGVIVAHKVVVAAGRGVNEVAASEVDALLLAVLAATPSDFMLASTRTGRVPLNGQEFLGAELRLITEIQLEDA